MTVPAKEKIIHVCMLLTYRCDSNCRYCHLEIEDRVMAEPDIDRMAALLKASPYERVHFNFLGGEPLTAWDALVYTTARLKKSLGKRVSFSVATNGLLLDKSKLRFLKKNEFDLRISCEGAVEAYIDARFRKEIHTVEMMKKRHRRLVKNLSAASVVFPDVKACMVVIPEQAENLCANYGYIKELGIPYILIYPVIGQQWKPRFVRALEESLRLLRLQFAEKHYEEFSISLINGEIDYCLNILGESRTRYQGDFLVVDTDGSLYADELMLSAQKPDIFLGTLFDTDSLENLPLNTVNSMRLLYGKKLYPAAVAKSLIDCHAALLRHYLLMKNIVAGTRPRHGRGNPPLSR